MLFTYQLIANKVELKCSKYKLVPNSYFKMSF